MTIPLSMLGSGGAVQDNILALSNGKWTPVESFRVIGQANGNTSTLSGTSEVQIYGINIPANTLVQHSMLRMCLTGQSPTQGTGTAVCRTRIGPTTLTGSIIGTYTVIGNADSTEEFSWDGLYRVVTSGSGGTIIGELQPRAYWNRWGWPANQTGIATPAALNTTIDNIFEVTINPGTGNNFIFNNMVVEFLR